MKVCLGEVWLWDQLADLLREKGEFLGHFVDKG